MKARVTTDQKHTIDSEKQRGKELKHNTKENHQTAKGKNENKSNTKQAAKRYK